MVKSLQSITATPRTMTVRELQNQMRGETGFMLIDVRNADEFAQDGHVKGARLVPLHMLASAATALPTHTPIVCICRSGNRSGAACSMLMQMGFENVTNVSGGMLAWHQAGLPAEGQQP